MDRKEGRIMRNSDAGFDRLNSGLSRSERSAIGVPTDAAAELYGAIGYETADLWLREPSWPAALPDGSNLRDPR